MDESISSEYTMNGFTVTCKRLRSWSQISVREEKPEFLTVMKACGILHLTEVFLH